jgi:predicted Zn finger-like uncharacterized protein
LVAKDGSGPQDRAVRITCPTCSAEYDVPGSLAPGRAVKCARCGNKWAPVPLPEPIVEAVPEPIPEPAPPPPPPTSLVPVPAPKPPSRLPLLLAWIGSAVVIVALLAAAFILRDAIMHGWPPSIRVYNLLGLTARP